MSVKEAGKAEEEASGGATITNEGDNEGVEAGELCL